MKEWVPSSKWCEISQVSMCECVYPNEWQLHFKNSVSTVESQLDHCLESVNHNWCANWSFTRPVIVFMRCAMSMSTTISLRFTRHNRFIDVECKLGASVGTSNFYWANCFLKSFGIECICVCVCVLNTGVEQFQINSMISFMLESAM